MRPGQIFIYSKNSDQKELSKNQEDGLKKAVQGKQTGQKELSKNKQTGQKELSLIIYNNNNRGTMNNNNIIIGGKAADARHLIAKHNKKRGTNSPLYLY